MSQITKEICVSTENRPGTLAKAAGCLKEVGVSIQGTCAWNDKGKSTFLFIADNHQKAVDALKKAGYQVSERDVVTSTLVHKVGTLAEVTQKLGQAGVNIEHCFVTASGGNALFVCETNDNRKAQGVIP